MSSLEAEGRDGFRASDVGVLIALKQLQYPTHPWKEEQARRLYKYLSGHDRIDRESLRLALYPEIYLKNRHRRESAFMRKVIDLVMDALVYQGYACREGDLLRIARRPTEEECLRILRAQLIDLWR